MNNKKLAVLFFMVFFISSPVSAAGLALPQVLEACASIFLSEQDGLWEKTLIVRFPERRRLLSTCDGLMDAMAAANHAAHPLLWQYVDKAMKTAREPGAIAYMRKMREKTARACGLRGQDISIMGTAADMDNLAVVTKQFAPFVVTALVTAGAKSNAIRTGVDEGVNIEPDPAVDNPPATEDPKPGTINILLLTNARLTDGALARAVITATEAKTAALEDLRVPSTYTANVQATGTGTDSMIVVSGTSGPLVTYSGGHSRIGELMGKAVHEAVMEALIKQNGFKNPR